MQRFSALFAIYFRTICLALISIVYKMNMQSSTRIISIKYLAKLAILPSYIFLTGAKLILKLYWGIKKRD